MPYRLEVAKEGCLSCSQACFKESSSSCQLAPQSFVKRSACPKCTKRTKSTELTSLLSFLLAWTNRCCSSARASSQAPHSAGECLRAGGARFHMLRFNFHCTNCSWHTLQLLSVRLHLHASAPKPPGLPQLTDHLLLLCNLRNLRIRMLEQRFPVTLQNQYANLCHTFHNANFFFFEAAEAAFPAISASKQAFALTASEIARHANTAHMARLQDSASKDMVAVVAGPFIVQKISPSLVSFSLQLATCRSYHEIGMKKSHSNTTSSSQTNRDKSAKMPYRFQVAKEWCLSCSQACFKDASSSCQLAPQSVAASHSQQKAFIRTRLPDAPPLSHLKSSGSYHASPDNMRQDETCHTAVICKNRSKA